MDVDPSSQSETPMGFIPLDTPLNIEVNCNIMGIIFDPARHFTTTAIGQTLLPLKLRGPTDSLQQPAPMTNAKLRLFGLTEADLPSRNEVISGSVMVVLGAKRAQVKGESVWTAQCPTESQLLIYHSGSTIPTYQTPNANLNVDFSLILEQIQSLRQWREEYREAAENASESEPASFASALLTNTDPSKVGVRRVLEDLSHPSLLFNNKITPMNMILKVIGAPCQFNRNTSVEVCDGSGPVSGYQNPDLGAVYRLVAWNSHAVTLSRSLTQRFPCWVHFGGIYMKSPKGSELPEISSITESFCLKILDDDDPIIATRFQNRLSLPAHQPPSMVQGHYFSSHAPEPLPIAPVPTVGYESESRPPYGSPPPSVFAYTPSIPHMTAAPPSHSPAVDMGRVAIPDRISTELIGPNKNTPLSTIKQLLQSKEQYDSAQPFRVRGTIFAVCPQQTSHPAPNKYLQHYCLQCFFLTERCTCANPPGSAFGFCFTVILEHEDHLLPVRVAGNAAATFMGMDPSQIRSMEDLNRVSDRIAELESSHPQLSSFCVFAHQAEFDRPDVDGPVFSLFGTKYLFECK